MNANTDTLPGWAREALRYAGAPLVGDTDPEGRPYPRHPLYPEGFVERVASRWLEIERDVLPKLPDSLSETGKTYFFGFVFGEAMRGAVATPRKARNAVRLLNDIRKEILDTALQLASLLQEHATIYEEDMAACDMPDLWALIEDAAADYPAWEMTAKSQMERFLSAAFADTLDGPDLADVLEALARNLYWSPQARVKEPAYRNRQASNADYVRLLIGAISRAACLPADFVLPDSAMAALVSVLFGLPDGEPSAEAVRVVRLSMQQRPDGDGVSPKNRTTTKQRRRGDPVPPTNPATHLLSGYWGAKPHS